MAIEVSTSAPPLARQSSRQLPLPLPLGPPVPPAPAPLPTVETMEVVPQHVWPRLATPAQAQLRQTFVRILQEVLHDDDDRASGAADAQR
jgi:hypothetical protein